MTKPARPVDTDGRCQHVNKAGVICGEIHDPRRCQGHNRTGKQCEHYPKAGLDVCHMHGAKTPRALAAGARRVEQAKLVLDASRLLRELGESVEVGDGDGLLAMRAKAWHEFLIYELLVADVDIADRGVAMYHQSGFATGEAKLDWRVVARDGERDRFAKLDEVCVKLGLVERQTRVAEGLAQQQGLQVAGVFRAAIADPESGLDEPARMRLRAVIGKHLRALGELPAG